MFGRKYALSCEQRTRRFEENTGGNGIAKRVVMSTMVKHINLFMAGIAAIIFSFWLMLI